MYKKILQFTWINVDLLPIEPLGKNFREIWNNMKLFIQHCE